MIDHPAVTIDLRRRIAAVGALALAVAAAVCAVVSLSGNVARAILGPVLVLLAVGLAWSAATRRGVVRLVAGVLTVAVAVAFVFVVVGGEWHGLLLVLVAVLVAGSVTCSRIALARDRVSVVAAPIAATPVGAARHGVLIMNLKSGGGKAEKFSLEDEARSRGIEPVVLGPDDDLLELARGAIARGADVIGMAGGDGSQALVASVAMDADVPLVCIPAGTRNHFALDLGLDRDDVVGALDAYGAAVERRIDLATVGGRVFVNNVSLGVYAKIVQSPEYRDAKGQTTAKLIPEMLGPDAEPFDLRFPGPDGVERAGVQLVLVSNNPYVLTRIEGIGSRPRLDGGELGVATIDVAGPAEMAKLVAAETAGRLSSFDGFEEWTTPSFVVESADAVEAGVDGEALRFDAPLEFRSLPGALRVRIPTHAPGRSPAALAAPSAWWTIVALGRAVAGRPTPIDEDRR